MKKILTTIIIGCCYLSLSAQPYFNEVYRSDTNTSTIFRSIVISDTAWYVTGITTVQEPIFHNAGFFARLSTTGNLESFKVYTDTVQTMQMLDDALIATNDGHLASIGIDRNEYKNACLSIFDANGDTLLYKVYKYDGPPTNSYTLSAVRQVRQDKDNNYYILARAGILYKPDSSNIIVMKTDSLGKETKRIFFPVSPDICARYGTTSDLQLLPNGHFIISALVNGTCDTIYPYEGSRSSTWIFEADTTGAILWQYLSPADRRIEAPKITLTHDGGIVFSGKEVFVVQNPPYTPTYKERQYIGKIDNNHELVWEYTNPSGRGYFSRSVELADGSILVCGAKYHRYHYEEQDSSKFWGYLVKFSATGDSLGAQLYHHLTDYNPSYPWIDLAEHYFQDMVMLPDSSLVMVGEIVVNWIPSAIGGYWGWVVHTDKDGCVEQEACFPLGIEASPLPPPKEGEFGGQGGLAIKVYPNPASEHVTFSYQIPPQAVGGTMLLVSDVSGKEVSRLSFKDLSGELLWDTRSIPEGLYYYTVVFGTEQLASGSLSIVHK